MSAELQSTGRIVYMCHLRTRDTMVTTFVLLALFVGAPILVGHIIYFGSSERHPLNSHAGQRSELRSADA